MTDHTPSRLLTRLDADIAAATDPVAADCLRAERAAYLARQGQLAEAGEAIEAIRRRHAARPNAAISAWLSLAEGLLIHFTDMGPQARDRVQRAYALSTAADLRPIRAISAAWMAHLEYLALNADRFVELAALALSAAGDAAPAARFRACLVIGMAFHLAARTETAYSWYQQARQCANSEGDDSAVSALLHNVAWLRACNLRYSSSHSASRDRNARQALLSAESSSHFDELIGATSLKSLQPLLWAFVSSAGGDYRGALDVYRKNIEDGVNQGIQGMEFTFRADMAFCLAKTNALNEAKVEIGYVEGSIASVRHPDDQGMILDRLSEIYDELGDSTKAAFSRLRASKAWAAHQNYQNNILNALTRNGFSE